MRTFVSISRQQQQWRLLAFPKTAALIIVLTRLIGISKWSLIILFSRLWKYSWRHMNAYRSDTSATAFLWYNNSPLIVFFKVSKRFILNTIRKEQFLQIVKKVLKMPLLKSVPQIERIWIFIIYFLYYVATKMSIFKIYKSVRIWKNVIILKQFKIIIIRVHHNYQLL